MTWLGITAFVFFCAGVAAALVGYALRLDVRFLFFVLWGAGAIAYAAAFLMRFLREGRASRGPQDYIDDNVDLDLGRHEHGHGHAPEHDGLDGGDVDGGH